MDNSNRQLLEHFLLHSRPGLWLLSDGQNELLKELKSHNSRVHVLTNRFDIHINAQKLGLPSTYSDWTISDCSALELSGLCWYLKINKEKPINYYLANQFVSRTNKNQSLVVAGAKNEGIKTFIKELSKLFNDSTASITKNKDSYWAELRNNQSSPHIRLDDKDYLNIRDIGKFHNISLRSKPGLYGWNKIDQGSAFFIEQIEAHKNDYPHIFKNESAISVLDLGCGYGFLTLASLLSTTTDWNVADWNATDNCAAAIKACEDNIRAANLNVDVIADDCAQSLARKFDLVLCNPPFHSGFEADGDLTNKFLISTTNKLNKNGVAFYVVNSFIPLEAKAKGIFKHCRILANNKQYKVIALSH